MAVEDWANEAVQAILNDISDRADLGDALDGIDDETKEEMVEVWATAIRKAQAEAVSP